MGKLAIFLGVLCIIGAFVALFALVIPVDYLQSNPTLIAAKNSLFCQPGERYVEELSRFISGGDTQLAGRAVFMYCENSAGQQRDITAQAVTIIIGVFAVPFAIGLILLIIGIVMAFAGWTRRLASGGSVAGVPVTVYTNQPGQPQVHYSTTSVRLDDQQIPPEAAEIIKQVMGGLQASAQSFQSGSSTDDSLVTKLRQLEEAREAGLISSIEYDRARQKILDSMKE